MIPCRVDIFFVYFWIFLSPFLPPSCHERSTILRFLPAQKFNKMLHTIIMIISYQKKKTLQVLLKDHQNEFVSKPTFKPYFYHLCLTIVFIRIRIRKDLKRKPAKIGTAADREMDSTIWCRAADRPHLIIKIYIVLRNHIYYNNPDIVCSFPIYSLVLVYNIHLWLSIFSNYQSPLLILVLWLVCLVICIFTTTEPLSWR